MPSSHALALGYISHSLIFLYSLNIFSSFLIVLYGILGLYYRTFVNLHTNSQVIVGYVIGVINSITVYRFTSLGNYLQQGFEQAIGEVVPREYVWGLAVVGAAVVGYREIKQARRFIPKKKE